MLMRDPRDVARADRLGHVADPRPSAVVEHPRLVRRLEGDRGRDGGKQHLAGFVVGRDENRDALPWIRRPHRRTGVQIPQAEGEEAQPDGGVHLEQQHR